jgi:hypothetical protein
MPRAHGLIDAALVVRAVGDDGLEGRGDLIQQTTDLGSVVHILVGQSGRDDPARPGF